MPAKDRNRIEYLGWALSILDSEDEFEQLKTFDCGDDDLNEFFREDALPHKEELLAETYALRLIDSEATGSNDSLSDPVAFVTFNNDNIELTQRKRKKLLPAKKARYRYLPAVKIGRLGVRKEYQRKDIGTHLLNMVKRLFLTNNRTGCRFITVDAYNKPRVLKFYLKNDFSFLHNKDENKATRIMYFDLKRLKGQL